MDEHARRMMQRFLDAVEDFDGGRLTLLDLSRIAGQTAATLDNGSAPLPKLLQRAESDLEYAYFATESEEHHREAARIVTPILTVVAEGD